MDGHGRLDQTAKREDVLLRLKEKECLTYNKKK
jgi:hypothetical protein